MPQQSSLALAGTLLAILSASPAVLSQQTPISQTTTTQTAADVKGPKAGPEGRAQAPKRPGKAGQSQCQGRE